jgi:hypothetical protein
MRNLDKIQALFAAYAKKDVAAVKAVMANDIIWRIPGHHPLAGPKHEIAPPHDSNPDGLAAGGDSFLQCLAGLRENRLASGRPHIPHLSQAQFTRFFSESI